MFGITEMTISSNFFLLLDMAQACTKWNVRVKTAHDAGDGTDNNVFMEVNGDPKSKTELNRDNLKTKNLLGQRLDIHYGFFPTQILPLIAHFEVWLKQIARTKLSI